ncbi:class I SAM-dependent methyltransferase [Cecembia sp.]|uniref:O-methyltransferase n=1 Tax=Cecembia sp. TaxID=1898110 RepID=UPI0025B80D9F|nr:class I SAM-dependent methyltransferase [Cecembia sp.]
MNKYLHHFRAGIFYWLEKEDQYSLQSPFTASLYSGLKEYLLNNKSKDLEFEAWRKKLLQDKEILYIKDYGAGSKKLKKNKYRSTQSVTRYSTSNRKFSQVYQFFCMESPAEYVLELGTCVGINSLYLSKASNAPIYSFEGSASLIKKAKEGPGSSVIQYIEGNISETLPIILKKLDRLDFILIDANHTYEGTTTYFKMIKPYLHENSIVAIGDIHWSSEMEQAWKEIYRIPDVSLSLDFFECGILLFKKELTKSHHILAI